MRQVVTNRCMAMVVCTGCGCRVALNGQQFAALAWWFARGVSAEMGGKSLQNKCHARMRGGTRWNAKVSARKWAAIRCEGGWKSGGHTNTDLLVPGKADIW